MPSTHFRRLAVTSVIMAVLATALWWASRPSKKPTPAAPQKPETIAESVSTRPAAAPAAPDIAPPSPAGSSEPAAVAPVTAAAKMPPAPSTPQPAPVVNTVVTEPAPVSPQLAADNAAGTSRMIMAHAVLRSPEVADPDSESNRRILQTMVLKAMKASSETSEPTKR